MAEAVAHGADVNTINEEDENKSPLIQAVMGVRLTRTCALLSVWGKIKDIRGAFSRSTLYTGRGA